MKPFRQSAVCVLKRPFLIDGVPLGGWWESKRKLTVRVEPTRYAELSDGTFHIFAADAEVSFTHLGVRFPVLHEWPEIGIVAWDRMLEVCHFYVDTDVEAEIEAHERAHRERRHWNRPTRIPVRKPRVLGL